MKTAHGVSLVMANPLYRTAVLTFTAMMLKLTNGTDDVLVLAPFVARATTAGGKLTVILVYICTVTTIVGAAIACGCTTNSIAGDDERLQQTLRWIAGFTLLIYSIFAAFMTGWCPCCQRRPDTLDRDTTFEVEEEPAGASDGSAVVTSAEKPRKASAPALTTYISVSTMVSINDFTVYLVMAATGIYRWYELLVGTLLGCTLLGCVVVTVTELSGIAHLVEKVPTWSIMMIVALYILASSSAEV